MKKSLLALLILMGLKNFSQSLVLTQSANEPIVGDTNRTYILDTTAAPGLMTNITGSNVVWNFTQVIPTSSVTTAAYASTTAVSSSSNYAGCTMVQQQGNLNTFLKSVTTPTTQTEFMGISSTSLNLTFTNTAIIAKYPISYGSVITDNFGGSFTFSISGQATGNINTTADGTGTLNLNGGISLSNVLRVKSVQTITLTSGFIPVGTIQQTLYSYYHASQKFPVLTISYQTIALTGQSPSTSGNATGNINVYVLGVKENKLNDSELSLYPNPAQNSLALNLKGETNTIIESKIFSQLGQLIQSNGKSSQIDISSIPAGVYMIEVKTSKGLAYKRFIKQ